MNDETGEEACQGNRGAHACITGGCEAGSGMLPLSGWKNAGKVGELAMG